MIRIAKLTRYGPLAASTRQRFDQYEPYLQDAGCETVSWPLFGDEYLEQLYAGQRCGARYVARRYLDRVVRLLSAADVDVLWVNYEVFPFLPGLADRLVLWPGKPVVFDFDDAIFHNYDLHPNALVRRLLGNRLSHVLSSASVAVCGNAYLRDYAARFCANTVIVPTVVDTSDYRPSGLPRSPGPPVIGWIGTPSTWNAYMAPLLPLLLEVADASGARILAVGARRDGVSHPLLDSVAWSEDTEIARIQDMDIGVMPLDDSPWARGKCGYKLIQYMACGIPVVASPVGVNVDIVEHGVNGFLASTPEEWRTALAALTADPGLRARMGAAGRARVERDWSLQVHGPRVAQVMRDVAAGARVAP